MSDAVLVVAAHPDDEVLGCGGAIVRHVRQGDVVHVVCVADGVRGRYDAWPDDVDALIDQRQEEARRAARELGVADVAFFRQVDQAIVATPHLIRRIEAAVARCRPRVVYAHRRADENRDHREVAQATCVAVRSWSSVAREAAVREIRGFPVPPVVDAAGLRLRVVLTAAEVERKLAALACYASELDRLPAVHPRHPATLRAQMTVWGSWVGAEHAEAFELLWRSYA